MPLINHSLTQVMGCKQVNELKKQVEQIKQQSVNMTLDELGSDQGDVTFRVGQTAAFNNKQKDKIRQMERQRREAQDVGSFAFYCWYMLRNNSAYFSFIFNAQVGVWSPDILIA